MLPSSTDLRFGTSSWAYEGWRGQVYHQTYPKSRFSQDCLREYAVFPHDGRPLFRTVGIDHTFYRPGTARQLAHYAAQVPEDFRFCSKVWEEITIPVYANLPRYGAKAGGKNPRFLDAPAFTDLVLQPALEGFGAKVGPFIFEFQRFGLDPENFLTRLDRFFSILPSHIPYAVELRNTLLLAPRYRDILREYGVAHVYNHWNAMPGLAQQHRLLEHKLTGGFLFLRLLTPIGVTHAEAVARYAPYDRLVQPIPSMRDEAMALIGQALAEGKQAYTLVNNRAEGNAPMTVQALVERLTQATPCQTTDLPRLV